MTESFVRSAFDEATGLGQITLARHDALNALNQPMADGFAAAVDNLTGRPGLRAIHIAAEGRAFAAGGDLSTFGGADEAPGVIDALLSALHPALVALAACPVPVITAVQGTAAGAGFALALAGDIILASEAARFAVAYTLLGGTPDCGMTHGLARRIGPARTLEMLLEAQVLTAEEAAARGIVTRVLPAEGFDAAARAASATLAAGPTRAFAGCKALMATPPRPLAEQLEAERQTFVATASTPDFVEGVSAFVARRAPSFTGQ
ncbi:MAG: enoyl-CoA hydratase/isomerase family protein [Vannielia sp.]|uniref:enoyl-CoA hydratase/isomerase family protein n=1 Tax=Vannielia sp. TaxID=2813045 RepID=UPI003B8E4119